MAFRPPFTSGALSEVSVVAEFPSSPKNGDMVQIGSSKLTFVWSGSEWEAIDALGYWAVVSGEEIEHGAPARIRSDGLAEPCLASTHLECHGIAGHVDGDNVFLVTHGTVSGYAGLTPGGLVGVHRDGGVSPFPLSPLDVVALMPVGWARSESELFVEIQPAVGV